MLWGSIVDAHPTIFTAWTTFELHDERCKDPASSIRVVCWRATALHSVTPRRCITQWHSESLSDTQWQQKKTCVACYCRLVTQVSLDKRRLLTQRHPAVHADASCEVRATKLRSSLHAQVPEDDAASGGSRLPATVQCSERFLFLLFFSFFAVLVVVVVVVANYYPLLITIINH